MGQKMNAVIFTGGQVFADSAAELELPADARIIAADSGYLTAKRLGVMPELLLGDLDSLDRSAFPTAEFEAVKKIIVPAIKDDTDTQLAVDTALNGGASRITIVGGLGGRLDHTLSTVFLLEYIAGKNASGVITDGRNRVRLLRGGETMRTERGGFRYLSLISLTDTCGGVSISGVFYPLEQVELTRAYSYAVSNEITADAAEISLASGSMLVIESRD